MPTKKTKKKKTASVAVQLACRSAGVPSPASLRRWARLAASSGSVTLRVVGSAEGRRLNRDFRDRDYATNVLSFDYRSGGEALDGDIVLCHPVIAREAREQQKPLRDHYAHLVVPGLLHLRGMDHLRPAAREAMERREIGLLAKIGIPDPYVARAVESLRDRIRP